jgi:glycosyltransferase involved in cell wall biosynthesis
MKILFIQKMAGVAGSEHYYLNILPALREKGNELAFLVIEGRGAEKNDEFVECLVRERIFVKRIKTHMTTNPRVIYAIAKFIKTGRYDIVQSNLIHADVWTSLVKLLLVRNMTLISAKHGYDEPFQVAHGLNPDFIRPSVYSALTWWAARYADRVLFISEGLRRLHVEGRLVSSRKCTVIPYGVTFAEPAVSQVDRLRFGDPQLAVVARLVPFKQHELIIEAMPRIRAQFPNVKLVCVGSGPEEQHLKSLSTDIGVGGNIVWAGYKSNSREYMEASDILVVPSASEGFGLVILEAWSKKKAVVAFDVPAPNEIITDNIDGVLVKPFDKYALADGVLKLLRNPATLEAMGRAGYEKYKSRYTLETMAQSTQELYQRAIEQSSSVKSIAS